jgi:SHS2 domain-containing protein
MLYRWEMGYETFEHEADIGIKGFGRTLGEAFENGARAMFSIMLDLARVEARDKVRIYCSAPDEETLFVEWLNELLAQASLKEMAFSDFKVETLDRGELHGYALGEKLDQEKHKVKVEVKAATYSMLKVYKNKIYTAQCIVDV